MRFNEQRMETDNPCRRDCPDRSASCHGSCERYKVYRAKKDAECSERARLADVCDYRTHASTKMWNESLKRNRDIARKRRRN